MTPEDRAQYLAFYRSLTVNELARELAVHLLQDEGEIGIIALILRDRLNDDDDEKDQ